MGSGKGSNRRTQAVRWPMPPAVIKPDISAPFNLTERTTFHNFNDGRGDVFAERHLNLDGSDGGWVATTATVAATVYLDADASVYEQAEVLDEAGVMGGTVCGKAVVRGDATIGEGAVVSGNAFVAGSARVHEGAKIHGNAVVTGHATVNSNADVSGDARLSGHVLVTGRAVITDGKHESGVLLGEADDVGKVLRKDDVDAVAF